jgi:hypothetical protein
MTDGESVVNRYIAGAPGRYPCPVTPGRVGCGQRARCLLLPGASTRAEVLGPSGLKRRVTVSRIIGRFGFEGGMTAR